MRGLTARGLHKVRYALRNQSNKLTPCTAASTNGHENTSKDKREITLFLTNVTCLTSPLSVKCATMALRHGLLALAAIAAHMAHAAPRTINVPNDVSSIQGAILQASSGDTVLVAPGTYYENLDYLGKDIVVTSSRGSADTVVDGRKLGPVVVFRSGETRSAVFRGFTVRNGEVRGDGGGIYIWYSSPTVVDNEIAGNSACGSGNGIAAWSSGALIRRNQIRDNALVATCEGGLLGGGVFIAFSRSLVLTENLIERNSTEAMGGGVGILDSTPKITRNVIRHNTITAGDGGGFGGSGSSPMFAGNLVYGNTAGGGGGVYVSSQHPEGAGIYSNNTIADNFASKGSELVIDYPGVMEFHNNIIRTSTGTSGIDCAKGLAAATFQSNLVHGTSLGDACGSQIGQYGNFAADPGFVERSKGAGRYRLARNSAAVDAGINSSFAGQRVDLAGKPRIVDGEGNGTATIDVGAFEYQPASSRR